MNPRDRENLVERAASAWRPRRPGGGIGSHPAWHDLDEAGRREAFDAAWKSNMRNLELLERHAAAPSKARRSDSLFVVGLIAIVVALVVGLLAGAALLTGVLLRLITGT